MGSPPTKGVSPPHRDRADRVATRLPSPDAFVRPVTSETTGGWRWQNLPVPVAHVGGLVVGGALEWLRPWPLAVDAVLGLAIGGSLLLAGLVVVGWSVLAAGRQEIEAPTVLVTGGPYRYSRNPMYVGWTGLYFGVALLAHTAWPLVLFPAVAMLVHRVVRREERGLSRQFGDAYRVYRRAVRRYL